MQKKEANTIYIYPDNLKQKATMWLWKLSDLTIIGVAALISILMLVKLGFFPPVVITAVYAFLSIQFDGASVKDFLKYAIRYFVTGQKYYEWRTEADGNYSKNRKKKALARTARNP